MKRKKTRKPKQAKQAIQAAISPGLQRPIFVAFFLSGFAGLMHQVVWAKLLVQLIGATAYAQVVVLAVFMGGLALGAFLFANSGGANSGDDIPMSQMMAQLLVRRPGPESYQSGINRYTVPRLPDQTGTNPCAIYFPSLTSIFL